MGLRDRIQNLGKGIRKRISAILLSVGILSSSSIPALAETTHEIDLNNQTQISQEQNDSQDLEKYGLTEETIQNAFNAIDSSIQSRLEANLISREDIPRLKNYYYNWALQKLSNNKVGYNAGKIEILQEIQNNSQDNITSPSAINIENTNMENENTSKNNSIYKQTKQIDITNETSIDDIISSIDPKVLSEDLALNLGQHSTFNNTDVNTYTTYLLKILEKRYKNNENLNYITEKYGQENYKKNFNSFEEAVQFLLENTYFDKSAQICKSIIVQNFDEPEKAEELNLAIRYLLSPENKVELSDKDKLDKLGLLELIERFSEKTGKNLNDLNDKYIILNENSNTYENFSQEELNILQQLANDFTIERKDENGTDFNNPDELITYLSSKKNIDPNLIPLLKEYFETVNEKYENSQKNYNLDLSLDEHHKLDMEGIQNALRGGSGSIIILDRDKIYPPFSIDNYCLKYLEENPGVDAFVSPQQLGNNYTCIPLPNNKQSTLDNSFIAKGIYSIDAKGTFGHELKHNTYNSSRNNLSKYGFLSFIKEEALTIAEGKAEILGKMSAINESDFSLKFSNGDTIHPRSTSIYDKEYYIINYLRGRLGSQVLQKLDQQKTTIYEELENNGISPDVYKAMWGLKYDTNTHYGVTDIDKNGLAMDSDEVIKSTAQAIYEIDKMAYSIKNLSSIATSINAIEDLAKTDMEQTSTLSNNTYLEITNFLYDDLHLNSSLDNPLNHDLVEYENDFNFLKLARKVIKETDTDKKEALMNEYKTNFLLKLSYDKDNKKITKDDYEAQNNYYNTILKNMNLDTFEATIKNTLAQKYQNVYEYYATISQKDSSQLIQPDEAENLKSIILDIQKSAMIDSLAKEKSKSVMLRENHDNIMQTIAANDFNNTNYIENDINIVEQVRRELENIDISGDNYKNTLKEFENEYLEQKTQLVKEAIENNLPSFSDSFLTSALIINPGLDQTVLDKFNISGQQILDGIATKDDQKTYDQLIQELTQNKISSFNELSTIILNELKKNPEDFENCAKLIADTSVNPHITILDLQTQAIGTSKIEFSKITDFNSAIIKDELEKINEMTSSGNSSNIASELESFIKTRLINSTNFNGDYMFNFI